VAKAAPKILAVDDNSEGLYVLTEILSTAQFEVIGASTGEQALELAQAKLPDLILLDVNMPGIDGFEVTKRLRTDPRLKLTPIILLTALDSLEDITHGFSCGADDYIKKPYQQQELLARVEAGLRMQRIYRELDETKTHNRELSSLLATQRGFGLLIGKSDAMGEVFSLIERLRNVDVPVLITGESGTGKELVARAIHNSSQRANAPLVVQNCSAFNENLLESEFFGHVRGAFSGAIRDKRGLFEEAHQGTFFLDELGEMALPLQAKLLRVLQDGTFTALGDTKPKKVDVRIVAATNRSLEDMVKKGTFREDLYYRINVVSIHLPPLRERRSDIPILVESFLKKHEEKQGKEIKITVAAIKALTNYDWPGNVRQLQNEVERFLIMAGPDTEIDVQHLSSVVRGSSSIGSTDNSGVQSHPGTLKDALSVVERDMICASLARSGGNKSESAKELGISRSSLIAKVKEYQLGNED
jgi:two-component system, NtrC family, response regulator AtoC